MYTSIQINKSYLFLCGNPLTHPPKTWINTSYIKEIGISEKNKRNEVIETVKKTV
jgi:hypothetical protein